MKIYEQENNMTYNMLLKLFICHSCFFEDVFSDSTETMQDYLLRLFPMDVQAVSAKKKVIHATKII